MPGLKITVMAKFANLKNIVKEMNFRVGCFCENVYANELVWQTIYRIAGKFGGGKVWQIDLFRVFGERKFGEVIDQPIDY